jgi:phage terminase large subunit-like protein
VITTRTTPPDWAIRTEADRRAVAAGYWWDQAAADRAVRFIEAYVSSKFGTAAALKLLEWQRRFIMSLYGWRRPDGGRRWRKVLLHVPKKNGKTLLVSALALYELLGAGVVAPFVVSASTTKDNALQVYEQLIACCDRNRKLKAATRPVDYRKRIYVRGERGGEYRALSADAPNAEGLNCSTVIVDEAHAHRSPRLYRALEYAMIGRPDGGFQVIISTAGDDLTHWYYDLVERGRRILAGEDLDLSTYAEIYEAKPDAGDDLDDPAVWKRCNPSLDQYPGFTTEAFREQWEAAKKTTPDRLSFERYRFNVFRRAEDTTWISLDRWDACRGEVPPVEALKTLPCYLGFDASQRVDPTSISAVWVRPGRRFYVRSWAWVAEAGARERERSNLPKYRQFVAEGSMMITPGDVIEKAAVIKHLEWLISFGNVKALVMDPNGAWVIGQDLDGVLGAEKIFRQPQTHRWFNGPTRELEVAAIQKRITHDGSAWARWCIHSVRLDVDRFKNVRPVKAKSADHIDGAIGILMPFALADQAAAAPPAKPSVYETRGFATL